MNRNTLWGIVLGVATGLLIFTSFQKPDRHYKADATLTQWQTYINLLDSATKYTGSRHIEVDDALAIRQGLQKMKADLIQQLQPQILADSNYYKQQDTIKPKP